MVPLGDIEIIDFIPYVEFDIGHFPCFPCAVGTLLRSNLVRPKVDLRSGLGQFKVRLKVRLRSRREGQQVGGGK